MNNISVVLLQETWNTLGGHMMFHHQFAKCQPIYKLFTTRFPRKRAW